MSSAQPTVKMQLVPTWVALIALAVLVAATAGMLARVWTFDTTFEAPQVQEGNNPQLAVLDAQVQQLRDGQEAVINTAYFAIGAALTLGLLLVGYSWISQRYLHDQERQQLRDTWAHEIATAGASLTGEIGQVRVEVSAVSEQYERLRNDLTRSAANTSNVQQFLLRIQDQLGDHAASIATNNEAVAGLSRSVSDLRQSVEGRINSLDRRTEQAQLAAARSEGASSPDRGRPGRVLWKTMEGIQKLLWETLDNPDASSDEIIGAVLLLDSRLSELHEVGLVLTNDWLDAIDEILAHPRLDTTELPSLKSVRDRLAEKQSEARLVWAIETPEDESDE